MNNKLPKLTPAFEAYLIGLIYRNTRTSCLAIASLCLFVSHDALERLLYMRFAWSRRLWDLFASSLIDDEGGYLVIDDTTWKRYAKRADAVSWVWDSTAGKIVSGMQVVLLIWTDGKRKIPLSIRIWRKGGRSKVLLAEQMLKEAKRRGIKPKFVLFDSWYAAASLLNAIESLGFKYVARLKSNRIFEGKAVKKRWRHRFGSSCGRVRKVKGEVFVVKDGRKYFISNDKTLSSKQLKKHYRVRQQIEEVFRLLKQEFGWGGCSARKLQAHNAHLHLSLYAMCIVQKEALEKGETIYQFKHNLFRLPIPNQLPQLNDLMIAA